MKKLSILTTFLFALGLFVVPATFASGSSNDSKDKQYGQSEYQKDQKGQSQAQQGKSFQQQKQNFVLVEHLNGAEVLNAQGENIGEFESVLVDVKTGKVGFVTLTSGGTFGVGGESYIIPFNALKNETPQRTDGTLGVDQMRFTLNKSRDQLKRVPEGDIEEALAQEGQSRGIFEHYGISPYWEDDQDQQKRQDDNQRQMMQDTNKDHKNMNKDQMMDNKNQNKY